MLQRCTPKVLVSRWLDSLLSHILSQGTQQQIGCPVTSSIFLIEEETRKKVSNAYTERRIYILEHKEWIPDDICCTWLCPGDDCLPLHHRTGRVNHSQTASHHWLLMVACNVLSKNSLIFWVSQAMNSTSDE